MTERRNDSMPLSEFIAEIPLTRAWLAEQAASCVCIGCGAPFSESWESNRFRCFVSVSSVWCETKRGHFTRRYVAEVSDV